MILGLSLSAFTTLHVVISLVAIAAGLVAVFGMLGNKRLPGWTAFFLLTTILTSVTGFMFPFDKLLPSHITGIISLVVLAIALLALYVFHLSGGWRWIYVVTAVAALYFNVFVAVVQAFQKISFLKPGADAIGAAVPHRAGRGAGDLRLARLPRGETVSSRRSVMTARGS
jgi:hypothetical protein